MTTKPRMFSAKWTITDEDLKTINEPLGPPDDRPWTLSTVMCERCKVFHLIPPLGYNHEKELLKKATQDLSDKIDQEILNEIRKRNP